VVHDLVFVGGVALLWALAPPLAATAVIALLANVLLVITIERRPPALRRDLAHVTPRHACHVRNFAGDENHRGAGRELLGAVCAEADGAGRVLYLDTVAERLVEYYGEFGFEERAVADLARGRGGLRLHRMIRDPATSS
jgi:hypothetical protein